MEILKELNIKPQNKELFETAFIHTSYANEKHIESYERLEFLGDAVLELIMSEYLFKLNKYKEGEMTKLRSYYVCENALYEYSKKIGLNKYIKLGNSEIEKGENNKAITSDVFESFLGAIFLDQGIETAKKYIYDKVIPLIENNEVDFFTDYKSKLQEFVQTDKRSLEYIIINETGPAHNKTFTTNVKIDNMIYGTGKAHTKKESEQLAAKDALNKAQKGR